MEIFGFSTAQLVNLLTLKAKKDHPYEESVLEYIPALLRELHQQRANDDMRVKLFFTTYHIFRNFNLFSSTDD